MFAGADGSVYVVPGLKPRNRLQYKYRTLPGDVSMTSRNESQGGSLPGQLAGGSTSIVQHIFDLSDGCIVYINGEVPARNRSDDFSGQQTMSEACKISSTAA
ncbi:hypothetical protein DOTSEDRAFT_44763 [Dothistroma septosporum NZE10]|uniref:Uncharacterized protein n=1 Tax=Dothistroma septosporum (strain NZE10 / CBS 128990) TaxID=675120 RepID=N1PMG7_DOTSN|nr:hypothetical protein DOTSEDRAFT_44763 [Dothistroma septosporum NZE10]